MSWDELKGPHADLLADHVPERPSRALRSSAGERNIGRGGGGAGSGTQVPTCLPERRALFGPFLTRWCLTGV